MESEWEWVDGEWINALDGTIGGERVINPTADIVMDMEARGDPFVTYGTFTVGIRPQPEYTGFIGQVRRWVRRARGRCA
jgi:hypothetical protein